jgi:O-antigen ligase
MTDRPARAGLDANRDVGFNGDLIDDRGLVVWRPRVAQATAAVWWMALALMVATEYKLRKRANDQTVSGSVDAFIVLELAVYAAIGAYVLVKLRPHLRPVPIVVWTVGWCLTAAVSTLYAPSPLLAIVRAVQLVIIVLLVLRITNIGDVALMRRFAHGYVVLTTVSVGIGLAYVAPQSGEQVGRFTWLFTHSVVAGSMLAMGTVLLYGMWLTHRVARLPWARWVYGALLVVNLVSLIRTRTRGSIGAALLAIIVITVLWLRAAGKRDLLVSTIVVVLAVAFTVGHRIVAYYLRDTDASKLASFNNRTQVWEIAIASFERRPLHGLGLTASRSVFLDQTGLGGAHNAYINVLVDVGLLGMFWWGGLLLLILGGGWRLRRRVRRTENAEALTFDTLVIVGLMVCQLVNGVTAEYVGAGVGAAALMLYMTGAWVVLVGDACDAVDRWNASRWVDRRRGARLGPAARRRERPAVPVRPSPQPATAGARRAVPTVRTATIQLGDRRADPGADATNGPSGASEHP